ncbi:Rv0623-like domain-containing protein [Rhizobium phage RHph_X2_30]|nr:Rv0623-like domain-containing protein [Rhizobium phage RHph_X2_30]
MKLRWVKDASGSIENAYSHELYVGNVGQGSDGKFWWQIQGVTMVSPMIRVGSSRGDATTLEGAKARLEKGWSKWLQKAGLVESKTAEPLLNDLREIRERVAQLPELDTRSDDEIIGYDEHGIPEGKE